MLAFAPFFSMNLLVLVLLGFWGKYIAESKGYSGLFGFLVGFFGSLFGIIILAILPRVNRRKGIIRDTKTNDVPDQHLQNNPVEYARKVANAYYCPHCSNEVEVIIGYSMYECPHCKGKFIL
ncbi:MAG: hypothetical protein K8S87_08780 [Planctomycetes bacterium]|nr:hypothetical protein [Planctomycetota bacterium]